MEVTGQLLDGKKQGLLWLLGREHPVERGGGVRFHQKVPGEVQARNHGGLGALGCVFLRSTQASVMGGDLILREPLPRDPVLILGVWGKPSRG